MHINPWMLYLILQLDSINTMLIVSACIGILTIVVLLITWAIVNDNANSYYGGESVKKAEEITIPTIKRALYFSTAVTAVLFMFNAFMPTTKVMAAVVVIPAIVNNTNVQREAGELYDLAKQALKESITKDAATSAPTEKEEGDK